MKKMALVALVLFISIITSSAQKFSLSTNILELINFGTLNIEAEYALSQKLSADFKFQYNPWQFHTEKRGYFQNREQSYALGIKYWLWHINSGWFTGSNIQYSQYNRGGIIDPKTRQADDFGLSLSAGYAYMLTSRLNLLIGCSGWGGYEQYTIFSAPKCGDIVEQTYTWFLRLNEIMLQLTYIF